MPRQRLQVQSGTPIPQVRPVGRTTDTFVRPASAEETTAAQLARALSVLAPELGRLAAIKDEQQSKEDILKGQQAARETILEIDKERSTFAEFTRTGRIPAHLNPFMKQGYYEEVGRAYAGRLQADLTAAIDVDENLKNSVEMGDFRSFTSKFEKEWLDKNVPGQVKNSSFLVGYGNRRDAMLANLEAGWSAQTEERFTQRSLSMFRDEAVQFTMEALDREFTVEETGEFLKTMWNDKHALGWDSKLTRNTLIDAVADVALARKDPELMKALLESIPDGDGRGKAKLANTAYAIAKMEETAGNVFTSKRREWERTERETSEAGKALLTTAGKRFEKAEADGLDPDDVDINDLQAEALNLGLVDISTNLQTMKNAYGNREYEDDNDIVAGFLEKLYRAPGALKQSELNTALRNKQLALNTYNSLSSALKAQQTSGTGGKAFLEGDPFHQYGERAVSSYFGSSPDADTPDVANRRAQAKRQFSLWYYNQFVKEGAPNKGMDGFEKRQLIDAQAFDLKNAWVPYDASFSGTGSLNGKDFDWKTRPVDSPERVKPLLDELWLVLQRKANPSPELTSLLRLYNINPESLDEMNQFLMKQRGLAGVKR